MYDPRRGYSITLVFVDDVDSACARIPAAGGTVLDGPTDQPWGLRQAIVADPEGQRWELTHHLRDVQPVDWGAEQLAPLANPKQAQLVTKAQADSPGVGLTPSG